MTEFFRKIRMELLGKISQALKSKTNFYTRYFCLYLKLFTAFYFYSSDTDFVFVLLQCVSLGRADSSGNFIFLYLKTKNCIIVQPRKHLVWCRGSEGRATSWGLPSTSQWAVTGVSKLPISLPLL